VSVADFLTGAAFFVLATILVALARLLYSRRAPDWVMAEQLLGTAGIAALLLFGVATGSPGVIDLALMFTLLATFSTVAFATARRQRAGARPRPTAAQQSSESATKAPAGERVARPTPAKTTADPVPNRPHNSERLS
jgi:multicomponent Na+:H+ antiporter subunit F